MSITINHLNQLKDLANSLGVPAKESHLQTTADKLDELATEEIVSLSNSSEEKERKSFLQEINKFMSEIGKPLSKIPIMGYKELDLFQLFKEVVNYGGFNEVVKNVGTWSKIWKKLGNFDPSITDSSFRLKKNYERYLLEYEYKIYPDHRQQAIELERQIQMKRTQQIEPICLPEKEKKPKKQQKRKISPSFKDIIREKNGQPKMPLLLGELTIESLGTIIPKAPFITEKYIWPIGFISTRYFSSMINPEHRVRYTSKIIDGGDRPSFVVIAEDDPDHPILSHSPSGAWKIVLKRIASKSTNTLDDRKNISVSGAVRFGLSHPVVVSLFKELPNSDKCKEFLIPSSPEQSDLSPSSSPPFARKRKNQETTSSSNEDSEGSEDSLESLNKALKHTSIINVDFDDRFSQRSVLFNTREEIDDLENAVATLYALKYCSVY